MWASDCHAPTNFYACLHLEIAMFILSAIENDKNKRQNCLSTWITCYRFDRKFICNGEWYEWMQHIRRKLDGCLFIVFVSWALLYFIRCLLQIALFETNSWNADANRTERNQAYAWAIDVLATIVVIIFVAIEAVYSSRHRRRRRRRLWLHKMDWDMCETCPSLIGIDMSTKWAASYLESWKTTSLPQAMPFATKCISAVSSNFLFRHAFFSLALAPFVQVNRSCHPPNLCQVRASPFQYGPFVIIIIIITHIDRS